MSKTLTVSIVTYNAQSDIQSCLQSLKKQSYQGFDVIIVDNHSKDKTLSVIHEEYPEAKVIVNNQNVGFGKGHNIALNRAKSDWVLVLNQDVQLMDNAIEKLMEKTDDTAIGSIGPLLYLDKEKQVIDTAGLEMNPFYHVRDRGAGKKKDDFRHESGFVWGISAAACLYRTAALEQVCYIKPNGEKEYFDETFFMYKEDVDLAARLQKNGWGAWLVSDAEGIHERTGSKQLPRNQRPGYVNQHSYKNHLLFLIKNAPLFLFPLIFCYEFLKFMYLLFYERSTVVSALHSSKDLINGLKRRYA